MPTPHGLDHNKTLKELFGEDSPAYKELLGKAKGLSLHHVWRLDGWAHTNKQKYPTPTEDPILKDLTMTEKDSIRRAFEKHVHTKGDAAERGGWSNVNPTYACGACCACCAVVVRPR